jgi:hypothetical protein
MTPFGVPFDTAVLFGVLLLLLSIWLSVRA